MKATGSLALDTSIVVRHLRTDDQEIGAALSAAAELYLPLTALGELRFGVKHSGQQRAVEQLERFLREVVILHPDETSARADASLKHHLAGKGKPIPENDIWIAATARSHDLPLYCRDAHFDELASEMVIKQAPISAPPL